MTRLIALFVCLISHSWALAQERETSEEESEVTILADFGFAGVIPGERNAPVTIVVQAQDDNITGTVELLYRGGYGESGRIVAPISAAANAQGSVSIVAPIPSSMPTIELVLRDRAGKRLAGTTYATIAGSTEVQLPSVLDPSEEILLSATPRVSASRIAGTLSRQLMSFLPGDNIYQPSSEDESALTEASILAVKRLDNSQSHVLRNLVGADVLLDSLPLSQHAYEGVAAIVADRETVRTADPRAILTLQRWVLGGGRLIILADTPGSEWTKLLPPIVPTESIELRPQQEFSASGDLLPLTGDVPTDLVGRPIELALPASDAGWTTKWNAGDASYLAEGPAGFGWVTLVGMHPSALRPGGSDESWIVWADVLRSTSHAVHIAGGSERTLRGRDSWWYSGYSISDLPVQVFDAIGQVPDFTGSAIFLVAAVTLSLALVLGPLDFVLLKKLRLRHLAWLSALLWILIATVFSIIVPERMRASETSVSRHTLVDAMLPNEALEESAQNARIENVPEVLRSWTLAFTNIFAGSGAPIELEPSEGGVLWREYVLPGTAGAIARPLTVSQEPVSGGLDAVRAGQPVWITPGIWSTKVLTETGPRAFPITVSLTPTDEGWSLDISGLEADRVLAGQLRVGEKRIPLRVDGNRSAIDTSIFAFVSADALRESVGLYRHTTDFDEAYDYPRRLQLTNSDEYMSPALLMRLPGPSERTHAIEAMLATERFALIELTVQGQPLDIPLDTTGIQMRQSTMYRILTPIEGDPHRD